MIRAILDAEDSRLDPPEEFEADDCGACAGDGCDDCDWTGKSNLPPAEPCRCKGDKCYC